MDQSSQYTFPQPQSEQSEHQDEARRMQPAAPRSSVVLLTVLNASTCVPVLADDLMVKHRSQTMQHCYLHHTFDLFCMPGDSNV